MSISQVHQNLEQLFVQDLQGKGHVKFITPAELKELGLPENILGANCPEQGIAILNDTHPLLQDQGWRKVTCFHEEAELGFGDDEDGTLAKLTEGTPYFSPHANSKGIAAELIGAILSNGKIPLEPHLKARKSYEDEATATAVRQEVATRIQRLLTYEQSL